MTFYVYKITYFLFICLYCVPTHNRTDAEFYYKRDWKCINTFFKRRFGFIGDRTPNLKEVKKLKDLDKEVRASGFNHLKDMDYITEYINNQRGDIHQDSSEEEEDHDNYFLQEGVTTEPKLVLDEEENPEEDEENEESGEDSLDEIEETKDHDTEVKKGRKLKDDKYIKKAIRSKFKKKKKIPYNRNRNKAKGRLLKSLGL